MFKYLADNVFVFVELVSLKFIMIPLIYLYTPG